VTPACTSSLPKRTEESKLRRSIVLGDTSITCSKMSSRPSVGQAYASVAY